MANLATSPKFLGAFCRWQFWMWESKIWGRWVSWFISCGHGTVSHQLQISADVLQKWRDILWSKFANVSLMFFATYPQIFIPFYLVVLAAVTFLHITESPCSKWNHSNSNIEVWIYFIQNTNSYSSFQREKECKSGEFSLYEQQQQNESSAFFIHYRSVFAKKVTRIVTAKKTNCKY